MDRTTARSRTIRLRTTYTPAITEEVRIGFATASPGRIWLDGELIVDETRVAGRLRPGPGRSGRVRLVDPDRARPRLPVLDARRLDDRAW